MNEPTAPQFLALLRKRGIEVTARDGRLQINAPAGAVDAQLRAELARRKAELLEALEHPGNRPRSTITPTFRPQKIPQTQAQQGMWLIDHFTPGNVAYNIPEAFDVSGPVEPELLQQAIDNLLVRHESLRTFFYEEDGELLQAVAKDARAHLEFTDLSLSAGDAEAMLQKIIRDQSRQPFTLNQAPLVRFHLFHLPGGRNVIFYNIHHIIADRRSLLVLRAELIALYTAAFRGEAAALPPLSVQYADYACWADAYLAAGNLTGQIEYWKRQLAGVPPYLSLPLSRPYPERRTAWGSTVPIRIDGSLRDKLAAMSRDQGATMFMTLLAAFAVLLSKLSGTQDLCIGSPFTHRNQVETERLIGLFVNMLVLRCKLEGDPDFREVLRRVRSTALDAFDNSDVPFQELVRQLKPDPRSLRSPLFQVMFQFDSVERAPSGGLLQIDTDPGTARFDLTLQLEETQDGIFGTMEYCTDLFDKDLIQQMASQFLKLLEQVTANPDIAVSSIDIAVIESPPPPSSRPASAKIEVEAPRRGILARLQKLSRGRPNSSGH